MYRVVSGRIKEDVEKCERSRHYPFTFQNH